MRADALVTCLGACGLALSGCAGEAAQGRPWIHKVILHGVKHVRERDLRKHIALEATSWVPLSRKKYLDPFTVDGDRARIQAYYRAHGWYGARVTNAEVKPHGKSGVDVEIFVDEGDATTIASVDVTGLAVLDKAGAKLERDLKSKLKVGALFDHQIYLDQRDGLAYQLKQRGHAWASVTGHVDVNRDTRTADIHLTIDPGPQVRFRHVHVRGTEKIDPRLIAIHSGLKPNDRFTLDSVEDARGKVYQLGVFASVKVDYERVADDPNMVDLIITVREGTFHELRLGGGIGIEALRNDVHASAVYTRHNFLGGLRTLKLTLTPAYVFIPAVWNLQRHGPALGTEATLIMPDVPWALSTLRFTIGFDVGIDYAYQYYGPKTSLSWTRGYWRDRVLVGLSYNFQLLKFWNTDPAVFFDPSQSGRLFGYVDPYRLGWWQQDFAFDLRDRPLDPHYGAYLAVETEEGGVYAGGAFQYEKVLPEVRGYVPLGSRVTLAMRVQFGQMFLQGDLGSPVTRRFYLGGPNSHRGFNYNRLALQVPSGIYGIPAIPLGGDQMLLAQAELRVNLFLLAGNWLSLAAFFDAGDVAAPACASSDPGSTCNIIFGRAPTRVNVGALHHAAGGGLRYKTVIGTVRFDFGVRLNRLSIREADGTPNPDPGQRFAFHISVGESF